MSLWGELRRRDVFKVAVAYLIASWLIVQVVGVLTDPLSLPDILDTVIVVLLAIGFPFALIIAWVYDVTPEGIKVTSDAGGARQAASLSGQRLSYVVAGMLVVALALMAVDRFALERPANGFGAGSRLAVLPCDDLSPDPTDSFFAVGIHEELLNRLAALSALEIISRTSMQQYTVRRPSIPQIASELNADAIMECSARYTGDRVLLTAQLIDGSSDTHLWSHSYPADMSDLGLLFEVQVELAMDVANALNVAFLDDERERLERVPTVSSEAYALFLRAISTSAYTERRIFLDRAIEVDPAYAEAYAMRAYHDVFMLSNSGGAEEGSVTEAEESELASSVLHDVDAALRLNPNLGLAHFSRGMVHYFHWRWPEAIEEFDRAIDVSPNDERFLSDFAWIMGFLGRADAGVTYGQHLVDLAPQDVSGHLGLGMAYINAARPSDAARSLEGALRLLPNNSLVLDMMAQAQIMLGNYTEARESQRLAELFEVGPSAWTAFRAYRYAIMGDDQEALRLTRVFAAWAANRDRVGAGDWAMAHLAAGDHEQALESLYEAVERIEANKPDLSTFVLQRLKQNIFRDPVLEQPEFVEVRNRIRGD